MARCVHTRVCLFGAAVLIADPPDSLHLGGGITDENALQWLDAGAEKVSL